MLEVPFTEEQLEDGIADGYNGGGLVDEDGDPSASKLAKAIADEVLKHQVNKKADRIGGALHRDNLIQTLFPTLIQPRDYKRQTNPDLAKAIYEAILRDVNSVTSPNAEGSVQREVNKKGWVLCRIALSGGRTQDGYYVTQDWQCIAEDFSPAYRRKALLATERYGTQMNLLMTTVPALAKKAQREYESGMKTALEAGAIIFAPALAAATSDSNNGNVPADGGAEETSTTETAE